MQFLKYSYDPAHAVKMTAIKFLRILFVPLLSELSLAQNPVFTLPSAQTAVERGHLASSSRNGNVFISDIILLYGVYCTERNYYNVAILFSVYNIIIFAILIAINGTSPAYIPHLY